MHRYSAVLFDFDGTVAYTARDVWESVRYGFATCGLTIPEDYASDDRNLAYLVPDMVHQLYPEVPESIGGKVEQAVSRHYRYENTYPYTTLYPCVEQVLKLLRESGIPTGILSNKGHLSLGRILRTKGWEQYFTSYRGTLDTDADTLNKVQRLAAYSKTFDLSDALYIGDSAGDVEAARANHIRSVGVLYGDGDKALVLQSQPDVLCIQPQDLLEFFMKG